MAIKLLRLRLFLCVSLAVQFPVTAGSCASLNADLSADQFHELGQAIPNFGVVSPVLLRGGQPKLERLETLKRAGVKTVIDLRDGRNDIDMERKYADQLGLNFVSIPLSVFKGVSKDKVDKFLSVVRDPANQPVFIHCRQGQDRCGTMVAMYRLLEQSWTAEKAYAEMRKFGFHPIFLGLSASVFALKVPVTEYTPAPE